MSDDTTTGPADSRAGTATEDGEFGAAMSQLSTTPAEDRGQAVQGSFGGVRAPGVAGAAAWTGRELLGWARWFWRQLTSMRVALILLFLLSLAAIPGSVVPQQSVDPTRVQEFRTDHPALADVYDVLQLFDVYTSVWFSAIYLLLFVSLIGCIVPRTGQFVGQLRARPPRAPRRLDRMPAFTTWRTDAGADEVVAAARGLLRGRRYRVAADGEAVASEKGFLREAGNLAFHIALIVLLVAFAAGQLFRSEGGTLVTVGNGFSNTKSLYDDFSSGSLFTSDDLEDFGFRLDGFDATFEKKGPNRGSVRTARADVTYWTSAEGSDTEASIEVNKPLEVGDSKVYLLANGYAPVVSFTDAQGNLAYRGPVPFLPQDTNLTSSGVIKVPDAVGSNGEPQQFGFQGFFVPTFGGAESGSMFSQWPGPKYPVLFLTAYRGDLGVDAGLPQNVYQLDTDRMKQFKKADGSPFAQKMLPGETMKLPDGAGELRFEGIKRWANFQVTHQVAAGWALGGALAAIAGLAGSLFIQRRRVWVRAVAGPDGTTVVEMAGLGRSESPRLAEELGDLAAALQDDAPPAATGDPAADRPGEAEKSPSRGERA
ncbi:cytochrome c biogenesis protein ResB [Streptomyces sp. TR02-1]|uniref:cytochrome c biogenesis protein ResB n=1 Tax=Streptomyces sp. TR02-1 TaxID=3385977 RepID=UPI0039A2C2FD